MFLFLSKTLPLFAFPPGLTVVLACAAALVYRRRRRLAAWLLCLGVGSLYVFSTGALANELMGNLEARYPPLAMDQVPSADAIVVLGGFLSPAGGSRNFPDLLDAVDRLWVAAKLLRAGKAPIILVSGGNSPYGAKRVSEAASAKEVLKDWGVPAEAIVIEEGSRNTRENATMSKLVLDARGAKRVLLVTSAFHMPRAAAIFRQAGIQFTPVPTDFQTGRERVDPLFRFLPEAQHLARSQMAVKEWMGLLIYRLRGWA